MLVEMNGTHNVASLSRCHACERFQVAGMSAVRQWEFEFVFNVVCNHGAPIIVHTTPGLWMVCNLAASFERGREDDAERKDVARSDGAASLVCGDELLLRLTGCHIHGNHVMLLALTGIDGCTSQYLQTRTMCAASPVLGQDAS